MKSDLTIFGTKEVTFKGLNQAVCLYDIGGIGEPYGLYLPQKKEVPLKRLHSPLPIECFLLEGKTVSDTAISGHITHLGDNTAKGSLNVNVAAYSNLRILLSAQDTAGFPELYAKVLPQVDVNTDSEDEGIRLQFTWIPQEAKKYLEHIPSE